MPWRLLLLLIFFFFAFYIPESVNVRIISQYSRLNGIKFNDIIDRNRTKKKKNNFNTHHNGWHRFWAQPSMTDHNFGGKFCVLPVFIFITKGIVGVVKNQKCAIIKTLDFAALKCCTRTFSIRNMKFEMMTSLHYTALHCTLLSFHTFNKIVLQNIFFFYRFIHPCFREHHQLYSSRIRMFSR